MRKKKNKNKYIHKICTFVKLYNSFVLRIGFEPGAQFLLLKCHNFRYERNLKKILILEMIECSRIKIKNKKSDMDRISYIFQKFLEKNFFRKYRSFLFLLKVISSPRQAFI